MDIHILHLILCNTQIHKYSRLQDYRIMQLNDDVVKNVLVNCNHTSVFAFSQLSKRIRFLVLRLIQKGFECKYDDVNVSMYAWISKKKIISIDLYKNPETTSYYLSTCILTRNRNLIRTEYEIKPIFSKYYDWETHCRLHLIRYCGDVYNEPLLGASREAMKFAYNINCIRFLDESALMRWCKSPNRSLVVRGNRCLAFS